MCESFRYLRSVSFASFAGNSGHPVTVVQNPTISLADDVAVTKRALDQQSDQAVLVGHSYGGAVITEAGNHPKVAALGVHHRLRPRPR